MGSASCLLTHFLLSPTDCPSKRCGVEDWTLCPIFQKGTEAPKGDEVVLSQEDSALTLLIQDQGGSVSLPLRGGSHDVS